MKKKCLKIKNDLQKLSNDADQILSLSRVLTKLIQDDENIDVIDKINISLIICVMAEALKWKAVDIRVKLYGV